MIFMSILALVAGVAALALSAEDQCPPLPGNFVFGAPIPAVPADIPKGCSQYEIIVGKSHSCLREIFEAGMADEM